MGRLAGPFPFPIAQVNEGGTRIDLNTGGMFYPPPGQYLIITDANSIIQYFDPQSQSWQTLQGHSQGGAWTLDGFNYRIFNDSGVLKAFTVTAVGSGMVNGIGAAATGVSVGLSAGTQAGVNTVGTGFVIIGGTVAAPTVTQAGSFLVTPLIVIDPPPQGGIQATAHAVMTALPGGIASIAIDNAGAGYVASPNFWIIPQVLSYAGGPSGGFAAGIYPSPSVVNPANAVPGNQNIASSGALLTPVALTGSGTMTGITLVNPSGGYSVAPTVSFVGASGAPTATVSIGTAVAVSTTLIQPRINE